MARLDKNLFNGGSDTNKQGPFDDDELNELFEFFTPEDSDEDEDVDEKYEVGCPITSEIMDMLKELVLNYNPLTTAFHGKEEVARFLDLYGYEIKKVKTKNVVGEHEIAVKKGEPTPNIDKLMDLFNYSPASVLNRENKELVFKITEWLIKKFKNDKN